MTKKTRRPAGAEQGRRCHHCGQERAVAPLSDWQLVNLAYPMPGLFSMYRDIEQVHGPDVLLVVCMPCACFQVAGSLRSHVGCAA